MTDQPTGARYPAVVALLRRERGGHQEEARHFAFRLKEAEDARDAIDVRGTVMPRDAARLAYLTKEIDRYRRLVGTEQEMFCQIDAALAVLEGPTDDGE